MLIGHGIVPRMSSDSTPSKNVWLRLFWIVLGGYLVYRGIFRLVSELTGWRTWFCLGCGTWLIVTEGYGWWRQRQESSASGDSDKEAGEDRPLQSLVFLLEQPRKIEPGLWVDQLGTALGLQLNAQGDQSTEFIMPMPHPSIPPERGDTFMLKLPQGVFWIFHVHQPYFTDPQEVLEKIRDRRLRESIARHRAWLSVDLIHWQGDETEREEIYATIGRILAALAGPDVCAVLAPELSRCNEFDPALIERLRGGHPLSIFDEPTHDPVLRVEAGDADMQRATAEARQRWPEFVAHFARRIPGSDRPFTVKAAFAEGEEEEFMWVQVQQIDGERIVGLLGNQPHRLTELHAGQQVVVPVAEIVDWLCADERDRPLGGWTQAVLHGHPGKHLGEE
jgi:uncharacterized protein YegJ (DUF2314 family)